MATPLFLTLADVLSIHEDVLALSGGSEGVLNMGLLESAIASPQATYGGKLLNEFPFEMAATYVVGLAKNHAFADGNKRTASMVGYAFLRANGYRITWTNAEYQEVILAVATGAMCKDVLAKALRDNCSRR